MTVGSARELEAMAEQLDDRARALGRWLEHLAGALADFERQIPALREAWVSERAEKMTGDLG
ncbi:MAG: hypothetical protein ACT4OX_15265, partial [Actinomycetota bacterium]